MTQATTAVLEPTATEHFDQALLAAAGFLAGYRDATLNSYKHDLRVWFEFCAQHCISVLEARRHHIELFTRTMETTQWTRGGQKPSYAPGYRPRTFSADYQPGTIARRVSTICAFYRYCSDEDYIAKDPAANVRRIKVPQESTTLGLDRGELGAFLVTAGLLGGREHALACLLGLNGLRCSEAIGANIEDLAIERGHHTLLVRRKGNKRAIIPLAPRTFRAVTLVVDERTEGPLLLNLAGERMNRGQAYRMVRRIARRAGVDHHVHPHALRHAFITAALDAGVPLRDVQEAASHADPRTTARYDRNRVSLDRHAAYSVATFVAGATNGR